ncbi:hypothetical protein BN871_DT_00350 [Paenibacillus sp. P22]|nr:hypothetical protein BN871_DT_00350 [Paenibacillus sp. P22]
MLGQEAGCGFRHLDFHLSHFDGIVLAEQNDRADGIPAGDDRGRHEGRISFGTVFDDLVFAACRFHRRFAVVHRRFQQGTDRLVHIFLLGSSRDGDDRIPVRDQGDVSGAFAERFRIFLGEVAQLADRGVLLEDDFPVAIDKYLQRVSFADAKRTADFLRDNDTAQIIDPAHDSSCFHCHVAPLSLKSSKVDWTLAFASFMRKQELILVRHIPSNLTIVFIRSQILMQARPVRASAGARPGGVRNPACSCLRPPA